MRGWKQYLYDETGRRYLDAYNNVPHVGHCHPRVVEAARKQMAVLNSNTRYLHDFINRYARRLCATMPDPLNVCFFVNSASEGNELALRLARSYTGQRDMIVLEAAYHGNTTSLIDISPYKHDGPGGTGPPPWVHKAPIPDGYRGLYRSNDPEAARKYAGHVRDIIGELQGQGIGIAGFIAETSPSVAGQIFLPQGYLPEVYRHVRRAGGLCIADEVQTGLGRTGKWFAVEHWDVEPDILVMGKAVGGGLPLGAVLARRELMAAWPPAAHGTTFGGNPLACAAALATIRTIEAQQLPQRAAELGARLMDGLKAIPSPRIREVRGLGLMIGVELKGKAGPYLARLAERGVLALAAGATVMRFLPPLVISAEDVDTVVEQMAVVLET